MVRPATRWPGSGTHVPAAPETVSSLRVLPDYATTLVPALLSAACDWMPDPELDNCHSSVARIAVRLTVHVVFLHKAGTQRGLVHGRRVFHIEDLIARPYVTFGITVAIETPLHAQR